MILIVIELKDERKVKLVIEYMQWNFTGLIGWLVVLGLTAL